VKAAFSSLVFLPHGPPLPAPLIHFSVNLLCPYFIDFIHISVKKSADSYMLAAVVTGRPKFQIIMTVLSLVEIGQYSYTYLEGHHLLFCRYLFWQVVTNRSKGWQE
jgi:hypothetical protein